MADTDYKGTPTARIIMAAVKAFLGAFGAIIVGKLSSGTPAFTWGEWKPVVISAVVAGLLALWKFADIKVEGSTP